MSKGSNRRTEDVQKVRDNWSAIKWGDFNMEVGKRKNQELREQLDAMPLAARLREQNSKWMGDCPSVYEEAADWIEGMLK